MRYDCVPISLPVYKGLNHCLKKKKKNYSEKWIDKKCSQVFLFYIRVNMAKERKATMTKTTKNITLTRFVLLTMLLCVLIVSKLEFFFKIEIKFILS